MASFSSQPAAATGLDAGLIDSPYADTNYGNATTAYIGESNAVGGGDVGRIVIKFDISSIPVSAVIVSATLKLRITDAKSNGYGTADGYAITANWDESTVTWNNQPSRQAGAIFSRDMTEGGAGEVSFTLDPAIVQTWTNGTLVNYGILIKTNSEANDRYDFAMSDHATEAYRPKLEIEYTTPANNIMWWY
jgi:hypothetical protein